jgi:hypothetical protein
MWTGKFSRKAIVVSCAMLVPFCGLMAQDENVYTAKYKFNYESDIVTLSAISEPVGTGFSLSGNYNRAGSNIFRDWRDRVYLDKDNVGTVTFTNFKYEVKSVDFNVMTEILHGNATNITTTLIDFKDSITLSTSYNLDVKLSFKNISFINGGFSSNLVGLKSMSMKQLNDNTVYYQGKDNNTTPTFTISYYKPSVSFKSSMSSEIKLGQTLDVTQLYTISHKGAFNFTTTYKSSDTNIFTVDKNSGVITPKNLGKANITVTITDGEVKKTATKEIQVVAPTLNQDQYLVNLKYNDGTDRGETVIVTYRKDMPTVTPPTRKGYTFDGYWDNQTNGMGKQYYNKKGSSAAIWDKKWKDILFAHWAPRTYTVTFDLNDESHEAIFPDNVIEENKDRKITITNDGKMNVKFVYGESKDNSIDLSVPKKPGYEMLGWYDDNDDLIVTIDSKNRHAYITDVNDYWQMDGNNMKWNYTKNLVLKAKYRCKYTVEQKSTGAIIKFGTAEKKEIVEPKSDWLSSVVSDLVGAAKEIGTKENPVMAFDLRNSTNVWNGDGSYECQLVMKSLQGLDYISPNVLVYFNEKSYSADQCNNAILSNYTCPKLYVTDRAPIKVPYAFKADNALYERNKDYSSEDAAKAQAANSQWGTLCLPYPIRNNANNVKFYKLAGFEKSVMHYTPMNVDVIPANTPVLYKRLEGVGSEVKIKEAGVNVPVNTSYSTNPGSSLDSWQFIGTLTTKIFCGKDYDNKKVPAGAEKMDGSKEIYYFKQDQFTHLANKGKVTMLPYRAYFTTTAANAKFTTFSIIAIDEEGATDITNLIDNDAEGNGKIYDLNGRRVMLPVSGHLYIVNGKKKVY